MESERIQGTTLLDNLLYETIEDESVEANEVARLTKELEQSMLKKGLPISSTENSYARHALQCRSRGHFSAEVKK